MAESHRSGNRFGDNASEVAVGSSSSGSDERVGEPRERSQNMSATRTEAVTASEHLGMLNSSLEFVN